MILEIELHENYTKDGKKILELVQEWIDENNFFSNCENDEKNCKILL